MSRWGAGRSVLLVDGDAPEDEVEPEVVKALERAGDQEGSAECRSERNPGSQWRDRTCDASAAVCQARSRMRALGNVRGMASPRSVTGSLSLDGLSAQSQDCYECELRPVSQSGGTATSARRRSGTEIELDKHCAYDLKRSVMPDELRRG